MLQIRIHGRGGQGVVTAAEMLSVAAFEQGKHAQAFPSFGSERMGAPVLSFCRIADTPIRVREPVTQPGAVVVLDASLLHHVDLFAGLAPTGSVLINSVRSLQELGIAELADRHDVDRLVTLPATELARQHLGRPLPNICLLGAFAALTGAVSLSSLETAVRGRFPIDVAELNVAAARAAYATVTPQTHIVEAVGALAKAGTLSACEYLTVESEFSAMSAAIGASAAGARTYTATASRGLLFMAEALYKGAILGVGGGGASSPITASRWERSRSGGISTLRPATAGSARSGGWSSTPLTRESRTSCWTKDTCSDITTSPSPSPLWQRCHGRCSSVWPRRRYEPCRLSRWRRHLTCRLLRASAGCPPRGPYGSDHGRGSDLIMGSSKSRDVVTFASATRSPAGQEWADGRRGAHDCECIG